MRNRRKITNLVWDIAGNFLPHCSFRLVISYCAVPQSLEIITSRFQISAMIDERDLKLSRFPFSTWTCSWRQCHARELPWTVSVVSVAFHNAQLQCSLNHLWFHLSSSRFSGIFSFIKFAFFGVLRVTISGNKHSYHELCQLKSHKILCCKDCKPKWEKTLPSKVPSHAKLFLYGREPWITQSPK